MTAKVCPHHDDCFTCPLPDCRIPIHAERSKRHYGMTRADVKRLAEEGLKPPEIAAKLGISLRTAYRLRK